MTDIKKLLTQKENRNLEFKRELPSNQKPHYIKVDGKHKGTYVRVGSTNRVATLDILENLEREKRSISYDSVVLYDCEYKEGMLNQIDNHIKTRLGEKADILNYEKLKLVKKERDKYYLTNLGIWFSAIRTDYFPLLKIECARFKGTSTKVFLDQATFDGDMVEITSLGVLLIDKDKLGLGYSELRNQNLGNLFKAFKIIEQWGTGYEKIQKELQKYPEMNIEIDDTSSFVQVRLVKIVTTPITTKEKLLSLLKQKTSITREEVNHNSKISTKTNL